jgi:hypothetical protein
MTIRVVRDQRRPMRHETQHQAIALPVPLLNTYSAAANTSRFKLCLTSSASEAVCLRKSVGATHRCTTAPAVGRIMPPAQERRLPRRVVQRRQS